MSNNSLELASKSKDGRGLAGGGSGAPVVDPGVGNDIRAAEFTAKAVVFDDLPQTFRAAPSAPGPTSNELVLVPKPRGGELVPADGVLVEAGQARPVAQKEVLASGAKKLSKPRKAHGEIVSRMIGWQATPDRIVVTVADRALKKREDGKYAPAGDWAIEHRTSYDGTVQGRTGKVPVDAGAPAGSAAPAAPAAGALPAGSSPSGAPAPAAPVAPPNPDFEEGEGALSFLPAPVRSSVLARVPNPVLFDGSVHQYAFADGSVSHLQVDLLRMDHKTAIAVQGKLALKKGTSEYEDHWEVRQSVYTLSPGKVEQA